MTLGNCIVGPERHTRLFPAFLGEYGHFNKRHESDDHNRCGQLAGIAFMSTPSVQPEAAIITDPLDRHY
jgi:hypothetical protein